jgi:hypothetical protein
MSKRNSEHDQVAQLERELADLQKRHETLAGQVSDAASAAGTAASELQRYFETGDLKNTKLRAQLEAAALAADGRAAPLRRALEALAARITETEERLANARERKRRTELYIRARRTRDVAEKRLTTEYESACKTIVELIGLSAEALNLVTATNHDLPEGEERLDVPSVLLAGRMSLPKTIISESEIVAWARASDGARLAPDAAVTPDAPGATTGACKGTPCILSLFQEVSFHPAETVVGGRPLYEAVNLPALFGNAPYWTAHDRLQREAVPEAVRRSLATKRWTTPRPPERRRIETEYVHLGPAEPTLSTRSPTDEQKTTRRQEGVAALVRRSALSDEVYARAARQKGERTNA